MGRTPVRHLLTLLTAAPLEAHVATHFDDWEQHLLTPGHSAHATGTLCCALWLQCVGGRFNAGGGGPGLRTGVSWGEG